MFPIHSKHIGGYYDQPDINRALLYINFQLMLKDPKVNNHTFYLMDMPTKRILTENDLKTLAHWFTYYGWDTVYQYSTENRVYGWLALQRNTPYNV